MTAFTSFADTVFFELIAHRFTFGFGKATLHIRNNPFKTTSLAIATMWQRQFLTTRAVQNDLLLFFSEFLPWRFNVKLVKISYCF